MKILAFEAENFKKLRTVWIQPNGRVVELTGKNGQGKTSVLDAVWFGLKGRKALGKEPVRRGAQSMKVVLTLGNGDKEEITITRTKTAEEGSIPVVTITDAKGEKLRNPQELLDALFNEMTFDPLEFLKMDESTKVATLRRTAKITLDFEKLDEEDAKDYEERKLVNRELGTLDGKLKGMQEVYEGLPKEKLDESAIMKKLNEAGEYNRRAQQIAQEKMRLGAEAARLGMEKTNRESDVTRLTNRVAALKAELKAAEDGLKAAEKLARDLAKEHATAEKSWENAPKGDPVDVSALAAELESAQRTNRAIERRTEYDQLKKERDAKQSESNKLTDRMTARENKRKDALANAKIPIEGLSFDDGRVRFKGMLLENLGEGEQINISAQIAMAGNPKLRVMCVRNGEMLDEENLKVLAKLAEEHDFQVWMTRVDTSGKVGIVLEDGMVVARNEEVR